MMTDLELLLLLLAQAKKTGSAEDMMAVMCAARGMDLDAMRCGRMRCELDDWLCSFESRLRQPATVHYRRELKPGQSRRGPRPLRRR